MLALVAALFLWRSASSLFPPRRVCGPTSAVAGRDSLEGMTALLHRGVAERRICWTRASPNGASRANGRAGRAGWSKKRSALRRAGSGGGISAPRHRYA